MVDGSIAVMLLFSVALFAGLCHAIGRAFFSKVPGRTAYRMAALWSALFAAAVIGSPFVSDSLGAPQAAMFAFVLCCIAYGASCVLPRWWEGRDVAAAVAYLQTHQIPVAEHGCSAPDGRGATVGESAPVGGGALAEAESDPVLGTGLDLNPSPDPTVLCAMAARDYDLTRREEEVLLLLLDGRSFASIAGELFISDNTVKTHVRHIYRKMGVNRKEGLSEKVFGSDST